jgi:hypothetical protein
MQVAAEHVLEGRMKKGTWTNEKEKKPEAEARSRSKKTVTAYSSHGAESTYFV